MTLLAVKLIHRDKEGGKDRDLKQLLDIDLTFISNSDAMFSNSIFSSEK